jgi:Na+/proline symporter
MLYWKGESNFFKMFFSGIFITVVMTGLDQDMMQKNLTVGTLKDAQKNMYWLSANIVFVNFIFLTLGAMLYVYAEQKGIALPERKDMVFAELALNHLPLIVGVPFVLGTVAAAYSSADSALTSLTTSFSIDFLEFNGVEVTEKKRISVHIGFSLLLFLAILVFSSFENESIVWVLFKAAGLTYGPLLAVFVLGIFTGVKLKDKLVPFVCGVSAIVSIVLYLNSQILFDYTFGVEISLMSTSLTIFGLLLVRDKS